MVSDTCAPYEDDTAAFVLGDISAERRADMVVHLESCATCQREVTTLTDALDAISAATVPLAPRPGFVDRVLAAVAASEVAPRPAPAPAATGFPAPAVTPAPAATPTRLAPRPAAHRPVAVVLRRRRTLSVLTGVTALLTLLGLAFHSWIFLAPAVLGAVLDASYLALVISITHTRARMDMASAFQARPITDDAYWQRLRPERPAAAEPLAAPVMATVAAVDNLSLLRFVLAYFLGWALLPLVGLITLIKGDEAEIERSPVLAHIVAVQRRGRAQSLRLLVAGATTVAVAGGGTLLATPAFASSAPAAQTYVVHQGDTLSGIAERFGLPTDTLARLNGITDPNVILPGEILRLHGTVPSASTQSAPARYATYTVRAGDTLDGIAARAGTTLAELLHLNHIANPNFILVGQVLHLPPGHSIGAGPTLAVVTRTYTVRAGDTLDAVAARFGTTAARLAAINHLANPNIIMVGQVLQLVGGAPSASAPTHGTPPAPPVSHPAVPVSAVYVNPFRFGSWSPSRIDEGVDWIPNEVSPVVAIGDGVVTYSSMSSGWPAGGFISYRLTTGSHAGYYIYVAEHITDLLPVGTYVHAGERIATALPGYPWTEWGWAASQGPEPAPGSQYGSTPNGSATYGGKAFARFLISLGVTGVENPGPGPTTP